mgnify:CR=1 FL=1
MLARLLQTAGKCGHLSYVHCDGARLPFARVLSLSLSGLAGSSGSSLSCLTSLVLLLAKNPMYVAYVSCHFLIYTISMDGRMCVCVCVSLRT